MMQRKETIIGIVVILGIALLVFLSSSRDTTAPEEVPEVNEQEEVTERVSPDSASSNIDLGNTTFTVNDKSVSLVNGSFEESVVGSSGAFRVKLLEGSAFADVNDDNVRDAVVLLREETGGTGIFYYTAVVLADGGTGTATNSVFIGDRIRIKKITIEQGVISIDVLERNEGEAMAAEPTQSRTYRFRVDGQSLVVLE